MFNGHVTLADYLKMDEAVMLYYFQCWEQEEDVILRIYVVDLSIVGCLNMLNFIHRMSR